MTAQPHFAAEHPGLSAPPDSTLRAVSWRPVLERSAHEWIDKAARHSLPSSSLVVMLDHGTGHWLKALMPLGHRALAADPSRERLDALAQQFGCAVSRESDELLQRFAHGPRGSQALLLHAGLDSLSGVIRSSGLKADAVCVNAIGASFPSPEIIFDTCMPWLKDGGLPGSGIMEMARRASEFPHVLTEEVEALVNASHICQFFDIMFSDLVILVAGLCWSCA